MIKRLGKSLLCSLLETQAKKLRQRNDFQVVAVGGSVGKTSTKLAIAKTLAASQRVIYQDGNYNDRVTVPLVLFGKQEPGIFNIFAWLRILVSNQRKLRKSYPYDIAVLEIGTDAPGQMAVFAYLQPDIYVLTAIAAEHMQFFKQLDAVAQEELAPVKFSKKIIINTDDTPKEYLPQADYVSYGRPAANYALAKQQPRALAGQQLTIDLADGGQITAEVSPLGNQGAKLVIAAAAVAHELGFSKDAIVKGLQSITPVAGRMQILSGVQGSTLIDDTYNASPLAVKAALDVLYAADAPQRIAILGSMNEMGSDSSKMHAEVGDYCDPSKLSLVVTIGNEAKQYLAPAAKAAGCSVASFENPYEAGEYVKEHLKTGAVILAKGSQNGVFAEEALKQLLANPADAAKLVRQSREWLKRKQQQFAG